MSRIFSALVSPAPWALFRIPVAWRIGPYRNIVAGMLAAIVSMPLAMGLGVLALAPLGPDYVTTGVLAGLYSAAFLGLIAVLVGARGVAIYAPRSLVSFVIASVCADLLVGAGWLPKDDPGAVISALLLLLAMAGGFQLVFGLAHLARMVKFIPMTVMAGFQNAAAIIITLSQLHVMLGLSSRPALTGWLAAVADIQPLTVVVGAVTLALVFKGHRISKRIPPLLMGLLGGTALYHLLAAAGFSSQLGATLGRIPISLPDGHQLLGIIAVTALPGFGEALPAMIVAAASIAVVASLDVLISAKVVENLSGQRGNSTRELLCIGAANTLTPLLGGIVGSISLGATTANHKSGASNSLSLLTHALLFLLLVPLLAPLLGYLPKVVIAALVMHAGTQLFDRWTLQLTRRFVTGKAINWHSIAIDIAVILCVTGIALAGEVVIAVALGVAIAVVVFTIRMSRGMIRSARRGDEVHSRREREAADAALLTSHGRRIFAIELEGPMFFASAELLHNRIDTAVADEARYVVLDLTRVNEVDSTSARILLQTWQRMKSSGVHLLMCGHDRYIQTVSVLRDHGVVDALTRERLFPDLDRALEWCENHLLDSVKSGGDAIEDRLFERLDITRGLTPQERETLCGTLERREYPAGSTVFAQGDEGDALYIIVRGTASVRLSLDEGRAHRRLVTFSVGTVFGEMALLDRGPRSATVVADEALVCHVLERSQFEKLAETQPRIGLALLSNLGRELSLRMRSAHYALAQQY